MGLQRMLFHSLRMPPIILHFVYEIVTILYHEVQLFILLTTDRPMRRTIRLWPCHHFAYLISQAYSNKLKAAYDLAHTMINYAHVISA
jgi:hypothetical protein